MAAGTKLDEAKRRDGIERRCYAVFSARIRARLKASTQTQVRDNKNKKGS